MDNYNGRKGEEIFNKEKAAEKSKDKLNVNDKEFTIIKLLGKGKGGYSYLATDGKCRYVLKQIHHEPCDYYQFGNKIEAEINDYKRLKNIGINMPEMIDSDIGNERILKEYIEGETIFDLVLQEKMKEEYFDQIRGMCSLLYASRGGITGDGRELNG